MTRPQYYPRSQPRSFAQPGRVAPPGGIAPPHAARAGTAVRRAAGAGTLLLLSFLFWLIYYQNLPNDLAGMASKGPVQLANLQDRIIKVTMIGVSLYFIFSRLGLARKLVAQLNPGALLFLVLAPVSAAWSIESSATLLRYVSLLTIFLVCFAIALGGWSPRVLQRVAIPPLMFIILGSLLVGMIAPDSITEIGTDLSQKNAWHGITHSKNEFGMISSIGVIICVNRWLSREGRAFWALAGSIAAFTCLVLSRSNTSLFATMVALMAMFGLIRVPFIRQRYSTHVAVGIALTLLLYELVIQNVIPGVNVLLAPIMSLTGKDTTFSSRTVIWNVIKEHIQYAPLLGTGYGAYWLGPFPSSPSYVFVPLMYFYPTEAHNGYLDIINDLGVVGLLVVLAFIFMFVRQSLRLMRVDRSQGALYLGLLFQQMVMNMSESEWFSRTSTFAVLILATTCLARGLLEARAMRPAGN